MAYIKYGALTKKSEGDALHIAYASHYNMDLLLSWNFKHMVDFVRQQKFNAVNLKMGYNCIRIMSPQRALETIRPSAKVLK